jgi:lipopolysaccharide/colanic/teichoic acid biosynthesis glycosyltransferase
MMVKRLVDVTVSSIALAVLSPVIAAVTLAIRVVDGSPIMFRQQRSGLGGRPFELVKFRTMRAATASEAGPAHDQMRLTRLGSWLRATSLDELPTLMHVVRGEMSLVGPRPLPVAYLERYDDTQARRLEARPGVTGWAQVHGRNLLGWEDKFELDVWYVDHASLRLDLRILTMTLEQVMRREGIDHADGTTMTEFRGTAE